MAFYPVSMKQLIINSILISFVSALTVILFMIGYEYYFELPIVVKNTENKCVKVLNFKNGEAFNCNDVDVVLRKYHVTKTEKE